jgi:hypothetical protein
MISRVWYISCAIQNSNDALIGAVCAHGQLPGTAGSTQIGSVRLANATMETYVQSQGTAQINCFTCHQGNGLGTPGGGGLSHIYGDLQPLNII